MVQRKRHVFIAVEGTHRQTKLIITKMLARKLRGKFKFTPPYFLVNTGKKYTDSRTMSRAYYCLGYYATAYDAAMLLPHRPIITGGYWLDQLAFGMVATFTENLPPADSPLYTWPRDLLMPDVIFFLNLPSHNLKNTFTEEDSLTFRSRLIQFYRIWGKHPPVIEVNSTNVHRDVIRIMSKFIEQRLGYLKHLEPTVPPTY
ncbi:UMP-CMP kinase 2, mitochondrial-like [Homalodisca vitripennis]|nr:UMP-CMP kinase 2, mitochondrial-like [Homalodisca vitripennis]